MGRLTSSIQDFSAVLHQFHVAGHLQTAPLRFEFHQLDKDVESDFVVFPESVSHHSGQKIGTAAMSLLEQSAEKRQDSLGKAVALLPIANFGHVLFKRRHCARSNEDAKMGLQSGAVPRKESFAAGVNDGVSF